MKHRWIAVFLFFTWMIAAVCPALAQDGESSDTEATAEYAALLFDDTRIHEIDLIIAEEDWADLVQNAAQRTKYKADIIIDGERFQEVSINTKGNSSLYGIIRKYEGSSRFSLRINFGSNIKKQTYHGLRKMELDNLYGDSSCMKNFISYDLFRKAGVPSPLASFVWLKINGRDQGLYLALHNYYLYERDGRLSMFPWDYNDAFGTFWALYIKGEPNDATSLANLGIDTPLLGVTAEQRPMWKWIADNEAYLEECHQAMDAFVSRFFESGYYQEKADTLYAMLLPCLTKDPTSFYTPQQFTDAYHAIRGFGMYRAQSIRLQLEGKLSASTADQNLADRIDVSDMVIGDMR